MFYSNVMFYSPMFLYREMRVEKQVLYALCIKQSYNCTTYVMTNKPNKATVRTTRMKKHDVNRGFFLKFNFIQRNIADPERSTFKIVTTNDRSVAKAGNNDTFAHFSLRQFMRRCLCDLSPGDIIKSAQARFGWCARK